MAAQAQALLNLDWTSAEAEEEGHHLTTGAWEAEEVEGRHLRASEEGVEAAHRLNLPGAGEEGEEEPQRPAAEGPAASWTEVAEEAGCSWGPLAVAEEVLQLERRSLEVEEAEQTNDWALAAAHAGRRMLVARHVCGFGFPIRGASLLVLEAGVVPGRRWTAGMVLPELGASFPRAGARTYRHRPTGAEL